MRIPSGVTDQYVYFVGVDSTDFATRETGLSSFTVYRSRNGGAAAAMTTPTINETDSTNMPGVYELLLDEDMTIDAGDDSQEMVFHITHAGMAPVTRTIELYRPKITAGETLTVSSGTGNSAVQSVAANAITASAIAADAIGASELAADAATEIGTAVWAATTRVLTAATNITSTGGTTVPQTGDAFARIGATGSGLTSLAQASVVGALTTTAKTGDPNTSTTLMAYIKQLVNVLIGTSGIATFPAEAAPGNAVSLAEVIRAIHADVTGLNGVAITGDPFARLGAPAGASVSADIAAVKSDSAAILVDTGTDIPARFDGIEGATFSTSTDSLEAIRDRGDAAWTTGAGGTPPQLLQNTTIATLSTQTSFTLTAGSADDDAYNGAVVVVTDSATSTQKAVGSVSDYTGSTKTITLSSDPGIFTMAAGDTIDVIANASTAPSAADVRAEIDSNSTQLAAIVADTNELQGDWANGGRLDLILDARASQASVDTVDTVADGIKAVTDNLPNSGALTDLATAAALTTVDTVVDGIQTDLSNGTDGLGAIKTAVDAIPTSNPTAAAIADAVLDEALSGHVTAGTTGKALADIESDVTAILADTNELQTDDIPSTLATIQAYIDTEVAAIKAVTDALPDAGALTSIATAAALAVVDTNVDSILDDTGTSGVVIAGTVNANMTQISGSSTAADNLEESALGIVPGECEGTPSTTVIQTNLAESTDDHYNGRVIVFTTGSAAGQATDITDYTGATGTVTVTALTTAPAATDKFVVI